MTTVEGTPCACLFDRQGDPVQVCAEHASAATADAALRKVRDTLRRPDLGPGTTLRIIGEIVDQALDHEPKETT